MRRRSARLRMVFVAGFVLAGCAVQTPPGCDGRHKRPVNIHGSVLGDVPARVEGAGLSPGAADPVKLSAAALGAARSASC